MKNKNFFLLLAIFIFLGIPLAGMVGMRMPHGKVVNLSTVARPMMSGAGNMSRGEEGVVGMAVNPQMAPAVNEKLIAADTSYMVPPHPGFGGFVPGQDRSIVKSAMLSLQVENPSEAVQKVSEIAQSKSGLVTNSNVYDYAGEDGAVQADVTLRVPTDRLDETIAELKKLASRVVTESVNAMDQTEQRVDLDAQLKNLRAAEQQFTSLLSQAKTVEETLQVQQQLNQTRTQIERLEAQRQSLEGAVQMASVSVNLSTKAESLPYVNDGELSVMEQLKLSVRTAFRLYRGLFIAGVTLLIIGSPVLILLGIGYFAMTMIRKQK